jgi:glycosyltransferase involved in cell wall biosynthesis
MTSDQNHKSATPTPTVSIGVAVYNGEATIAVALASLVSQTFSNFEIIISDNASTDKTSAICEEYANNDSRVSYIRQDSNLGAAGNFKFVLDNARGRYFMWAAADDIRSPDFLEENVGFLEQHPAYVASTSPNCFEGQCDNVNERISFSIEGETAETRFLQFFEHCWQSHALFYSLMRTKIVHTYSLVGESFVAADWAINLHLLKHGKIHRHDKGLLILGINGVSNQPDAYKKFRNQPIELLLPFYRLSHYIFKQSNHFSINTRLSLLLTLFRLNKGAVTDQLWAKFYRFYSKCRTFIFKSTNGE